MKLEIIQLFNHCHMCGELKTSYNFDTRHDFIALCEECADEVNKKIKDFKEKEKCGK